MNLFYQVSCLVLLLGLHQSLTLSVQDVSDPNMPFRLTITPALVNRYTTNTMTLRCGPNPTVQTKLIDVFRIRILKQSTTGWDLVAEQRDVMDSPTVAGNMTASANIDGDISGVFLQVSWDSIGPDCFGVFQCEVIGFDVGNQATTERASTLDVYEFKNFVHHLISLSAAAQEKVEEMKNFTDTEIARLDGRIQRLSNELTDVKQSVNDSVSAGRQHNFKTSLSSLAQWPTGFYALLQPKTGCPVDLAFYGGKEAYLEISPSTLMSKSDTPDSHSSAFSEDTISEVKHTRGNRVTLKFCEVRTQVNTASWPLGSFCVHKLLDQSCPPLFSRGSVRIFGGSHIVKTKVAYEPDGDDVQFCCQNTTSPTVSIQLPTHTPFLLYRFGGKCQTVQGMSVSEEFIEINTADHIFNYFTGSYPDVDLPGSAMTKFNLCYYTKL